MKEPWRDYEEREYMRWLMADLGMSDLWVGWRRARKQKL
jgi:hypothetical protein